MSRNYFQMFGYYNSSTRYFYGQEDLRLSRRGWADKSAAAIRREEHAKNEFQLIRVKMEERNDLSPGFTETQELLKPSCHLTKVCWSSFRKHVCSFDGWRTKRRLATAEEKKKHGEKRKANVYFTDVTYSVPRRSKAKENKEEGKDSTNKENSKENNKRLFEDEQCTSTATAATYKKSKSC